MRYGALLVLGLTVQLAATAASADRASDLADQASSAQRQTCQNVTSLSACHPAYPTGCSHSTNPQYDGYLNLLKNQTPPPSSGINRYITQTSIQSLDANTPAGMSWTSKAYDNRDSPNKGLAKAMEAFVAVGQKRCGDGPTVRFCGCIAIVTCGLRYRSARIRSSAESGQGEEEAGICSAI